jgi:hypothetical protein
MTTYTHDDVMSDVDGLYRAAAADFDRRNRIIVYIERLEAEAKRLRDERNTEAGHGLAGDIERRNLRKRLEAAEKVCEAAGHIPMQASPVHPHLGVSGAEALRDSLAEWEAAR